MPVGAASQHPAFPLQLHGTLQDQRPGTQLTRSTGTAPNSLGAQNPTRATPQHSAAWHPAPKVHGTCWSSTPAPSSWGPSPECPPPRRTVLRQQQCDCGGMGPWLAAASAQQDGPVPPRRGPWELLHSPAAPATTHRQPAPALLPALSPKSCTAPAPEHGSAPGDAHAAAHAAHLASTHRPCQPCAGP